MDEAPIIDWQSRSGNWYNLAINLGSACLQPCLVDLRHMIRFRLFLWVERCQTLTID